MKRLTIIFLTMVMTSTINAQKPSQLFFSGVRLPNGDTTFLRSYTLTPAADLFFITRFDKPLMQKLQELSPGTSSDTLIRYGNFQFTLLVDGKKIYESNLWPGAPDKRTIDSATLLNRALIDNKNGSGSWSESFWNRFARSGGAAALSDGLHILKMEIRPYLTYAGETKTGKLMAAGELPLQVINNPPVDLSQIRINTPRDYDGLPVSGEYYDTSLIKELKGKIAAGVFKRITSIAVIKNGKLLIEEYFNGANRETLHNTRSVGKSFASTLTGMAIADGHLSGELENLGSIYQLDTFANYHTGKTNTTLRELLTMSTGFDGFDEDPNSPGNEENMYPTANWVKFALDLPWREEMRGRWHYFTAGVVILGDVLNRRVPGGLKAYADEKLFKPLGIKNYQWQFTPQEVPNTAGGIQMNTLDFAKYGLLYKNNGRWKNNQLLTESWIKASFTPQKKIEGRNEEYYGYLFWNKSFPSGTKKYEAFYCAGNGGNYIVVFKDQPLVIVITATAYGQYYAHPQSNRILSEYLLPSLIR